MTPLFIVARNKRGRFPLPGTRKTVETHDLPTGAMWRCTCHEEQGWLIVLPHRNPDRKWNRLWCTLQQASDGQLWQVTGEAPKLTVTPSIDCVEAGGWHGHITNGELTDGEFHPL